MKSFKRVCVFLAACFMALSLTAANLCDGANLAAFADEAASNSQVGKKPHITAQPFSTIANEGSTVKLSVLATGENLKYQWYYRESGKTTWYKSTIKGCTSSMMSLTAFAYRDGYSYRCKVSNSYGYVYTNVITLSIVKRPAIIGQPQNQSLPLNETAVFSVSATGTDLKYQWQYKTKTGSTWYISTMPGAKTSTVSVPVAAKRDGYQYRCKVSNSSGAVYSDQVTLDVSTKPHIIMQSGSQTVMEGEDAVFYLSVEEYDVQYQWQYRRGPNCNWYNSVSQGNKTFALFVQGTKARNGFQFRCRVTNSSGIVYTDPVTLRVLDAPQYKDALYYGELCFPSKNYSIPLYAYDGSVSAETIVDRENSACFMNFAPTPLIADHVNQGFDVIKRMSIGEQCTIEQYGDVHTFECIEIDYNGINARSDLYMSDGRNATSLGEGLIAMYTCNESSRNVTIVVFREVA